MKPIDRNFFGLKSVIQFNYKILGLLLSIFFLFFSSCEKDDVDPFNEIKFDEYIMSLTPISEAMPVEQEAEIVASEVDTTTEYIYKTDYYEAAAGYNEQIVLNPQTDVIYPGALIKGETILDGTYNLIPAKRKSITISTSLTGASNVFIEIDDPKLSTVRDAVNKLMDQEYDVPPANIGFTIEQAYSEEQLEMSLRASYKLFGVNIQNGFDYSNTKIKTRLVAKFIQNYYTIDMDLPDQPSDLFDEKVDNALLGTYMPMYISTVTFGRMALFTVESELEEKEVKAYLNASYNSVDAEVSSDFESLKEKSTMKVYVLGGSGSSAGAIIDGFDGFKNYIKNGGNYSKQSPGAPIAYKLRYISDNSIGKIVFAASYPIVTAIPRTDNLIYDVTTKLFSFKAKVDDAGSECELVGSIKSWPNSLGSGVNHKHWGSTTMAENGTRYFSENTTTVKLWEGLKQNDTISVYVDIKEEDLTNTDQFGKKTFEIPVADIILSDNPEYYENNTMTVYDGSDYVTVTFRFVPNRRRTD